MRFVFIERHCRVYPVRVMCTILDVSPSGYYRWRQRPESVRQREDRRLRVEIRAIFRARGYVGRGCTRRCGSWAFGAGRCGSGV